MKVPWPAQRTFNNFAPRRNAWMGHEGWNGSLVLHGRDASGLYYRRNRFYDPGTGRFTQEDPIGIAGGLNVYGYANGDPISYADPYGLSAAEGCPPDCPDFREFVEQYIDRKLVAAKDAFVDIVKSVGRVFEMDARAQFSRTQVSVRANLAGESAASVDLVANPTIINLSASAGVRLSTPAPGSTNGSLTYSAGRVGPVAVGPRFEGSIEPDGRPLLTAVKANAGVSINVPGWTLPVTPTVQLKNLVCVGNLCPTATP